MLSSDSDYRRGLDWYSDLLDTLVTTNNYDSLIELHTPKITNYSTQSLLSLH
jgi:hypothetical protein